MKKQIGLYRPVYGRQVSYLLDKQFEIEGTDNHDTFAPPFIIQPGECLAVMNDQWQFPIAYRSDVPTEVYRVNDLPWELRELLNGNEPLNVLVGSFGVGSAAWSQYERTKPEQRLLIEDIRSSIETHKNEQCDCDFSSQMGHIAEIVRRYDAYEQLQKQIDALEKLARQRGERIITQAREIERLTRQNVHSQKRIEESLKEKEALRAESERLTNDLLTAQGKATFFENRYKATIEKDKTFASLQAKIHRTAVEHGWWEPQEQDVNLVGDEGDAYTALIQRTFGDACALIHSEISEALEAFRERGLENWYEQPKVPIDGEAHHVVLKPEGAFVELADAIIRILDLAEFHNVNMQKLIEEKMKYNETRPYRHGGKKL